MSSKDWSLDVVKRMLTSPSGALVDLTTGEFDLLHAFLEHPQRVLTRDQLLDIARGRSSVLFDRSIDVQVSRLEPQDRDGSAAAAAHQDCARRRLSVHGRGRHNR